MIDQQRPSPTIEDYLGVIYTLERDGERVIAARLVESLDVSAPTVNATLKRMQRDGWVIITENKEIQLTDSGCRMARSVIRRHMLTEWMLSRVLKLPLSELHREAHQIEHSLSMEVEERLKNEMEDPMFCPHGNPLPGFEGETRDWLPLSRILPGEEVRLHRIHESLEEDYESLAFLEENDLVPGRTLRVVEILSFNETIKVEVDTKEVVLGMRFAENLFVSKLK